MLTDDFITFKKELANDPLQGSDLGGGTRKVRMAVASKGRGKSGGARVITFNVILHGDDSIEITLLTIPLTSFIDNCQVVIVFK